MTQIETARFNDVMGLQIGSIQEIAHKLTGSRDLEAVEAVVAELDEALADLKASLAAIPHKHL